MKILVADDDKNLRKVLVNELSEGGFNVCETDNGIKAMEFLEKEEYDILLLDLNMPGLGGIDVLKKVKDREIPTEVIILTAHATVSTAVDAMKIGAYDYMTKPFQIDELMAIIEKAYEKKKLINENLLLKSQIKRQTKTKEIIYKSRLMFEILENVKKFAVSMLESELMGHEKGAFTGAYIKKLGLLEIANHGTLFLDEISELDLQLQSKLLRVIETGSFFRVGGIKEIKVDVRFVSATNKDLTKDIDLAVFRPDLYYRISALTIHIPPLRDRKEDIPLIVDHIIRNNVSFKDKKVSRKAMDILSEYPWPGNVRELQNVIHRALFLSKSNVIETHDLPPDLMSVRKISGQRLEDIEREHILKVFREVNGQKRRAAEVLGIDPKTLYRKLSFYDIKE
jgi:DNA-binding NtrC family response regulator